LTGFLHKRAACRSGGPPPEFKTPVSRCDREAAPPGADVQAALAILGARARGPADGALSLDGMDFRNADLTKLHLERAMIAYTHLGGAKLGGAILDDALVRGVNLDGADLERASLHRTNFAFTSLRGADLRGASLSGANLWQANLEGARLSGAQLDGARMGDVPLTRARLEDVDLRSTRQLAQQQIDGACTDEKTLLPEGLRRPPPCAAQ